MAGTEYRVRNADVYDAEKKTAGVLYQYRARTLRDSAEKDRQRDSRESSRKEVPKDAGKEQTELFEAEFLLPTGEVAAKEKIVLVNSQAQSYVLEYSLLGERFEGKVNGEHFEMAFTSEGKTRTEKLKQTSSLLLPPLLIDTLQAYLTSLKEGQKHRVDLLVPDRLETFSFAFEKGELSASSTGSTPSSAPLLVEFRPTNFFLKNVLGKLLGIIPNVQFFVDPQSGTPQRIVGPTFLKRKNAKGQWEPFLAETIFR